MSAIHEAYSPKQLARRALIVDAAAEILKREGVAACTARAIAAAASFTKGTIHYYFDDVREIINTAFLQMTEDYMALVAVTAAEADNPTDAFWRGIGSYLEGFRGHRRTGLLWVEYCGWAARNSYGHGIVSTITTLNESFTRQVQTVDPAATEAVAGMVRYLIGAVLEIGVSPLDRDVIIEEVARICGLPAPEPGLPTKHDQLCPLCRTGQTSASSRR